MSIDPQSAQPVIPQSERTMVLLCHLLSFCGFVIPFGSVGGPLILWLVKREESPAVDEAGRESLNFQITLMVLYIISLVLVFVGIGICMLILLLPYHIVLVILAVIKALDGHHYRYPLTIRIL